MLERIADGRTDLVFDYLAQGHAADAVDGGGVSLIKWCAYYGDVSAIHFLRITARAAEAWSAACAASRTPRRSDGADQRKAYRAFHESGIGSFRP